MPPDAETAYRYPAVASSSPTARPLRFASRQLALDRKARVDRYDEEIGCAGAPLMITEMQKRGVRPNSCIVGKPTSMRPMSVGNHA